MKRIFNGIVYGVTLLMISYLGIYLVAGNSAFEQEILNLSDINIFIAQLSMSAILGMLTICLIEVFKHYLMKLKEYKNLDAKVSVKKAFKYTVVMIIVSALIMLVIENVLKLFNNIIAIMFIIVWCIWIITYGLIYAVKSFVEEFQINRKIKEKNRE